MAAGPLPGQPNTTRLYIASQMPFDGTNPRDLIWSDDQGDTWPRYVYAETYLYKMPRIGSGGQLYISHSNGLSMFLTRSTQLDEVTGDPDFNLPVTSVSFGTGNYDPNWFPGAGTGAFRVARIPVIAVSPLDPTRLYAIWHHKSGEVGAHVNVDLFFTMTANATAQTVT